MGNSFTTFVLFPRIRETNIYWYRQAGRNLMECKAKEKLEQHLSDVRKMATIQGLSSEQREAVARAERFAIQLVKEHDATGHEGKRCPFATML